MSESERSYIPIQPVDQNKPREHEATNLLYSGQRLDESHGQAQHEAHPWYLVIWLTGVDYFSTLGYQPGIALLAAGAASPIATAILVLVTLCCALPIYGQVAKRSYVGQGSIAMLENLASGWYGRLLVLVLLGFAATDFVITMTLSAADAAQHAVENPLLHPHLGDHQMLITLGLLLLLAVVFLKGFNEAIGLAAFVAIPYLVLTAIIMGRAGLEVLHHPELLAAWKQKLFVGHTNYTSLALASLLVFPKLALGLSGFETGVSVMPLIKGSRQDAADPEGRPIGRIRNTRKLLITAALIMSVMLIISSFITAVLIPESAYKEGGKASGRAIAYLAHGLMGDIWGTVYDISTILILWFAGASAMAGLLNLVPRYLPRLGMAPVWVAYSRPLVVLLFIIDVVVTFVFRANVEKQGGAYATGVLVLMLSAALATTIDNRRERKLAIAAYCGFVTLVFGYTLIANIIERPDGIIIASIFIAIIILFGLVSRAQRATELRVSTINFADQRSQFLWEQMQGKKVNLVPLRDFTPSGRENKGKQIRNNYMVDGPLAFLNVKLLDNRSEFVAPLCVHVDEECGAYLISVSQAIATANTIAAVSELLDPKTIFLTLTRDNLIRQSLRYLFLGEGEIGLMVYTILLRYWDWTPEDDVRPCIYLMST